jgi:hypothetical protein
MPPSRYSALRQQFRVDPESALEEAKTCDLYRTAIVCFVCCALAVSDPRKVSEANVLALGGDWERELKFAHELTGKPPVWCTKCRKANSGGKGKRGRPAAPSHPVDGVENATKCESCKSLLAPSSHKSDLMTHWRPVHASLLGVNPKTENLCDSCIANTLKRYKREKREDNPVTVQAVTRERKQPPRGGLTTEKAMGQAKEAMEEVKTLLVENARLEGLVDILEGDLRSLKAAMGLANGSHSTPSGRAMKDRYPTPTPRSLRV